MKRRTLLRKLAESRYVGFAVALFFCTLVFGPGAFLTVQSILRRYDTLPTDGVVIAVNDNGDDRQSEVPVVEYHVGDGYFTCRGNVATSRGVYTLGEHLPVRYQRAHPGIGCIDTLSQQWACPLLFSLFGLLFAAGCIYAHVRREREDRAIKKKAEQIRLGKQSSPQSK